MTQPARLAFAVTLVGVGLLATLAGLAVCAYMAWGAVAVVAVLLITGAGLLAVGALAVQVDRSDAVRR